MSGHSSPLCQSPKPHVLCTNGSFSYSGDRNPRSQIGLEAILAAWVLVIVARAGFVLRCSNSSKVVPLGNPDSRRPRSPLQSQDTGTRAILCPKYSTFHPFQICLPIFGLSFVAVVTQWSQKRGTYRDLFVLPA